MSMPGSDLFHTRDVLEEHNLKPWWEKLRAYSYYGSVVFALFIMWMNLYWNTIQCLLLPENSTTVVLTVQTSKLVNDYCYRFIPWEIQYAGVFAFGVTLAMFISSNIATPWPYFIGIVKTYKHAEKLYHKDKICPNQLLEDIDKENDVCKCCCSHYLGTLYLIRNIITIACGFGFGSFYIYQAIIIFADPGYFNCELSTAYQTGTEYSLRGVTTFFCSYYVGNRLYPLIITYTCLVGMQAIATLIGFMWMNRCCCSPVNRSTRRFMHRIWKNSEPMASETFANHVKGRCDCVNVVELQPMPPHNNEAPEPAADAPEDEPRQ